MLFLGRISTTVLTFVFGMMVADRLVRDDDLLVYMAGEDGGATALGWSVAVLGVMVLPGLLFVGALGLVVPLLTGPALFRALFAGLWFLSFWPGAGPIPSLAGTVFVGLARVRAVRKAA